MSNGFNGSIDTVVNEPGTWMIHGTSVEATIELLRTGKLQRHSFHVPQIVDKDYLFFVPNPIIYSQDSEVAKYRDEFEADWQQCVDLTHSYATANGEIHHLLYKTGVFHDFLFEFPFDPETEFNIGKLKPFQMARFHDWANILSSRGISEEQLIGFLKEANSRKGVLLCLGQQVEELNHEYDSDDYAFKIFLPNGLDAKYIKQIVPQGEIEKRLLEQEINK